MIKLILQAVRVVCFVVTVIFLLVAVASADDWKITITPGPRGVGLAPVAPPMTFLGERLPDIEYQGFTGHYESWEEKQSALMRVITQNQNNAARNAAIVQAARIKAAARSNRNGRGGSTTYYFGR